MAPADRGDLASLIDALFAERQNADGLTAREWSEQSGVQYKLVCRAIEAGLKSNRITRGRRFEESIDGKMVPKTVFLPVKGKA